MGLHLIPRALPGFAEIAGAAGGNPASIGQALGVAERTVYRWLAEDSAPRAAHLALFWVTPWGWSQVQADAWQRLQTAELLADALRRELTEERALCARLLRMGYGAGSANVAVYRSA